MLAIQARESQEVTTYDSSNMGGRRMAAEGCVMVSCKLALCFVDFQDYACLQSERSRGEREGP